VFILDAVANYIPKDEREAQSICERITPRLAHANSAVVLSSVKVSFCLRSTLLYIVHGLGAFSVTLNLVVLHRVHEKTVPLYTLP